MALDRMRTSRHATHPSCRVVRMRTLSIYCGGSSLKAKTSTVGGKGAVKTVPDHDIPRPFHPDLVRGRAGRHLRHDQFDLVHQPQMAQIYVNPLWGKVVGQSTRYQCRRQLQSIVLVPNPRPIPLQFPRMQRSLSGFRVSLVLLVQHCGSGWGHKRS